MRVPIFLFNGILEAGKTAFINHLLANPVFGDGKSTLVIACEEGEVEYDENFLKSRQITVVTLEDEEELTNQKLEDLKLIYNPDRVVIEYNGMWSVGTIFELKLPNDWFMYERMCIVNAETFTIYLNNMRSIMIEQFKTSDLIVINRCDEDTNLASVYGSAKAVNPDARLYTLTEDFKMEPIQEEVPYDLDAEIVEIADEHYGIWYIDLWDHPDKYIGKRIKINGLFAQDASDPKDCFAFGRFAMPCCEDDIAFMGVYCHNIGKPKCKNKDSIEIIADIRWEKAPVYDNEEGPVLYVKQIKPAAKAQTDLVQFG